ncbi:MAG TPA: hypothetical protein VL119_10955 [Acidimicrobiia bacterium]|nr:hypothetical protein [Acidimicrobiia bacterium]
MEAEGWYQDPYGLHEDRWFSNGTATRLVRDSGVESHDAPPPDAPPIDTLVRSQAESSSNGPEDLRRADDAERGDSDPNYAEHAFETFGYTQTGWEPYRRPDGSH